MSKQMKLNCCLFSIDLNQLITAVVFFHWLRLCFFAIVLLMRSRMSQLQDLDINVGLYRDDGLAITNATPKDTENIKKEICRIFNKNGLRITIKANKQIINFLDVTFNLNRSTYQPFTKPNTSLLYVHRESNHPPIKQLRICLLGPAHSLPFGSLEDFVYFGRLM